MSNWDNSDLIGCFVENARAFQVKSATGSVGRGPVSMHQARINEACLHVFKMARRAQDVVSETRPVLKKTMLALLLVPLPDFAPDAVKDVL